eukprot:TRINITY_DN1329_c2_g1_i1.p1 TRINITY_DN1329_c2_g1~~TRINITY_DN1329_c2_g1_i1.p1  ORF type:complete len:103 (-),score=51.20 TRINITY_DN1329_c2_g1_i1:33-341(-)
MSVELRAIRAIRAYRKCLNTIRFISGPDLPARQRAQLDIRNRFLNSKIETDIKKIEKLIITAEQAANFMLSSVVRGESVDGKKFDVKPHEFHSINQNLNNSK